MFRNRQFGLAVSDNKQADWNAFQHVATGFLGNVKAINWKLVEDVITFYEKLGSNVPLSAFRPITHNFLFG